MRATSGSTVFARAPWQAVNAWGSRGWDLGSWPYQIAAHYDHPEGLSYGLATNVEGDTTTESFATRQARDAATDKLAFFWWKSNDNGPADLPADDTAMPEPHRGPYTGPSLI